MRISLASKVASYFSDFTHTSHTRTRVRTHIGLYDNNYIDAVWKCTCWS